MASPYLGYAEFPGTGTQTALVSAAAHSDPSLCPVSAISVAGMLILFHGGNQESASCLQLALRSARTIFSHMINTSLWRYSYNKWFER